MALYWKQTPPYSAGCHDCESCTSCRAGVDHPIAIVVEAQFARPLVAYRGTPYSYLERWGAGNKPGDCLMASELWNIKEMATKLDPPKPPTPWNPLPSRQMRRAQRARWW